MAEIGLFNTVDLGKLDALLLECGCSLLVMGSQRLAMTAPWREELYQDERLGIDGRLECGSSQADDVGSLVSEDGGEERKQGGGR